MGDPTDGIRYAQVIVGGKVCATARREHGDLPSSWTRDIAKESRSARRVVIREFRIVNRIRVQGNIGRHPLARPQFVK